MARRRALLGRGRGAATGRACVALDVAARLPDGPFGIVLAFVAGGARATLRDRARSERRGVDPAAFYAPTRYPYQRFAPPL